MTLPADGSLTMLHNNINGCSWPFKNFSTDPPLLRVTVRDAQRSERDYVWNIYKASTVNIRH